MSNFFNPSKVLTTRKPHTCAYCGEVIPGGSEGILRESGFYEGAFFSRYECQKCQPFIGEFWEWIDLESANIIQDFCEFMDERHCDLVADADD